MVESKQGEGSNEHTMFELCLLQTRAVRNVQVAINQRLETFGITMMEWLFLGVVLTGGAAGLSMTAVATALDVTLPQVTALNNTLVKQHLIRQKTQRHDRRSRHVIVTAKGKHMLEDIFPLVDTLLDTLREEIGHEHMKKYAEILDELAYYDKPLEQ